MILLDKVVGKAGCLVATSLLEMKGGGAMVSTYEAISLMITFGVFLISLISYLDRNKDQRK